MQNAEVGGAYSPVVHAHLIEKWDLPTGAEPEIVVNRSLTGFRKWKIDWRHKTWIK